MADPNNTPDEGLLGKLGDLLNKPLWGTGPKPVDAPPVQAAPAAPATESNQPFIGPPDPQPWQPSPNSGPAAEPHTGLSATQPDMSYSPSPVAPTSPAPSTANDDRVRELEQRLQAMEGRLQQQPAQPAASGRTYTVRSGDSLSLIAQQFYGDMMQWQRIYDANRDQISNPDLIQPGQELNIP